MPDYPPEYKKLLVCSLHIDDSLPSQPETQVTTSSFFFKSEPMVCRPTQYIALIKAIAEKLGNYTTSEIIGDESTKLKLLPDHLKSSLHSEYTYIRETENLSILLGVYFYAINELNKSQQNAKIVENLYKNMGLKPNDKLSAREIYDYLEAFNKFINWVSENRNGDASAIFKTIPINLRVALDELLDVMAKSQSVEMTINKGSWSISETLVGGIRQLSSYFYPSNTD